MARWRLLGWLVSGFLLGFLVTSLSSRHHPDGRLIVGGTGSTLSVVLLLSGRTIIVGGGTAPNEVVELVDRSTLPWRRPYDLLILPGWDTTHLPGALSLVERRAVDAVAVLGAPDRDPAWTILERRARERRVTVHFVAVRSLLTLDRSTRLELFPASDGTTICLEVGALRIALVDQRPNHPIGATCSTPIVLIAVRQSTLASAPVLVRPRPQRATDLTSHAEREVLVSRGEAIELRVSEHEVRVPLRSIHERATPPTIPSTQ
ncbi:MAG: hypothetical protein RMH81_00260 [Thermomicrobium sp.]|nr:hypothetical protein [Thermomicrobium sp.]